jgi:hypothetical protein
MPIGLDFCLYENEPMPIARLKKVSLVDRLRISKNYMGLLKIDEET